MALIVVRSPDDSSDQPPLIPGPSTPSPSPSPTNDTAPPDVWTPGGYIVLSLTAVGGTIVLLVAFLIAFRAMRKRVPGAPVEKSTSSWWRSSKKSKRITRRPRETERPLLLRGSANNGDPQKKGGLSDYIVEELIVEELEAPSLPQRILNVFLPNKAPENLRLYAPSPSSTRAHGLGHMPARPRPRVMGKSFEASGQPLLETILEEASIMSSSRSTRVLSEYDRDDPPQLPIVPSNLAPPTSSLEANSSASSSSTTLTEFGERAGGNGTHYLSANTETQASSSNSTVTLTEVRVQRQSTAAPASPDSDRLYSKDISSKPVPPIPPITTISSSEFTILSSPATPTKTPSSGYGYNTNFQPNVSESSLTSKRDASRSSPPLPHSPVTSQPSLALANKPPPISQPPPEARYDPSTGPRGEMPMRQALLPQASPQQGKASALANGHSHHAREPADAPMRSTGIPPPSPPGLLRHSRSYDPYEVESLYTVAPIISHPHLHPPPPPPPPPLKS